MNPIPELYLDSRPRYQYRVDSDQNELRKITAINNPFACLGNQNTRELNYSTKFILNEHKRIFQIVWAKLF